MTGVYRLDTPDHESLPYFEVLVRALDDHNARIAAHPFVKVLADAGYDRFELWRCNDQAVAQVRISRFVVSRTPNHIVQDYSDDAGIRRSLKVE